MHMKPYFKKEEKEIEIVSTRNSLGFGGLYVCETLVRPDRQ